MKNEIWKDIKNYEGLYQVSNYGNVKRILFKNGKYEFKKEKTLKLIKNNHNYYIVALCKNGVIKRYQIHRLVAETFISNPDNLPQVNHKDENKSNNCLENLEWCTAKYNCNYGVRNKKIGENSKNNGKKIYQIKDNKIIKKWKSIKEASDKLNINKNNICSCCKKRRKSAGGYKWRYAQ